MRKYPNLTLPLLMLITVLLIGMATATRTQAYPEFASRTGETCGACHFNPAGAGPRTPRGEIWVLDGKPDLVAEVDFGQAAIEETPVVLEINEDADPILVQGAQLFDIFTCGNCHGEQGEGSVEAPPLNQVVVDTTTIITALREGPEDMPAVDERRLSGERLDQLIAYVQHLASGREFRIEILDAPGPIFIEIEKESP